MTRTEAKAEQLHNAAAILATQGWTVTMMSPSMATLTKGQAPNHVLHAILSLLTIGWWLFVWLIVSLNNRPQTIMLTVEDDGRVWWTSNGQRHPWAP